MQLQSLSEVVGSLQLFTHNTAPLPLHPPQSMLFEPKHIKPDEQWDTTLNRGRGRLTFVGIQRFCGICPKTFETDQSLSEVIGTHVVLDCKWIITAFYTQYRSPPPPPTPINVAPTKTHQT
jgi:hypothetical protein